MPPGRLRPDQERERWRCRAPEESRRLERWCGTHGPSDPATDLSRARSPSRQTCKSRVSAASWAGSSTTVRRSRRDDARLGDRKGLLLDRFHVTLKKIVIEGFVRLGRTFEIVQKDSGLIGRLRAGHGQRETALDRGFPLLGDLIVALLWYVSAMRPSSSRIDRRIWNIWLRKLIAARWLLRVVGGQIRFLGLQIEILLAQLGDDLASWCARCVGVFFFFFWWWQAGAMEGVEGRRLAACQSTVGSRESPI